MYVGIVMLKWLHGQNVLLGLYWWIGHLCLSGIWQGLELKRVTKIPCLTIRLYYVPFDIDKNIGTPLCHNAIGNATQVSKSGDHTCHQQVWSWWHVNFCAQGIRGPYVIKCLYWTFTFEWCVARLGVHNGHFKTTCHNEIGLIWF